MVPNPKTLHLYTSVDHQKDHFYNKWSRNYRKYNICVHFIRFPEQLSSANTNSIFFIELLIKSKMFIVE